MSITNKVCRAILVSCFLNTIALAQNDELEGVVPYSPQQDKSSIYGTLNCRGSTNVGKLLHAWVPKFQKLYPLVESQFKFMGSTDGIKALMEEEANIGATSRPIRMAEIQAFQKLKGYAPTEIKVSLDALAIYVNRLNSIETITLNELDAIFSNTRNRNYPLAINNWETLNDKNDSINIYLFDKNSGTRSYFRHQVMLRGTYKANNIISEEYTTTKQVVNEVAKDPRGICFGSVGSNNFKVKTIAVSERKYYPTYTPTLQTIKDGTYPLTRFFYIYIDVPPDKPIPKLLYEFCKFALSKDGQRAVLKNKGIPLSPHQIGIELAKMRRE